MAESGGFKLTQVFSHLDEEIGDFSSLDVERSESVCAAGSSRGRIVMYHWNEAAPDDAAPRGSQKFSLAGENEPRYGYYGKFHSHEKSFDFLKSQEIEAQICAVQWLPRTTGSLHLLAANDKTIKLWKIYERSVKDIVFPDETDAAPSMPQVRSAESVTAVAIRKKFDKAHNFHINSISLNPNRETFLSADDLRINVWQLACTREAYNIVDLKPASMESLSEVITKASFHDQNSNLLLYATNEGVIKYNDLRIFAKCDRSLKVLGSDDANQIADATSSISDFHCSPCGNIIVARDYVSLKRWDLRQETKTLSDISIGGPIISHIPFLFESEGIFDKFNFALSSTGAECVTGTYGKHFFHVDFNTGAKTMYKIAGERCVEMRDERISAAELAEKIPNAAFDHISGRLVLSKGGEIYVLQRGGRSDNNY